MESFIITNGGKELQARMVAGDTSVKFTRVSASSHDYSGEELETLTELSDIKQTAPISSVTRKESTLVVVTASIDNGSLTDGYYVRALGLYAEDGGGNEVLFAVSTSGEYPDYMPPFSGGRTVSAVTYDMNIKVDNAEQVIIEVNMAAAPTVKEVEQIVKREISNHAKDTVFSEKGVHGLRFSGGRLQGLDGDGNWGDVSAGGGSCVQDSAPEDTSLIWIDTSIGGAAKYFNAETNSWEPLAYMRYYNNQLQYKAGDGTWQPVPLVIPATPSDIVGAMWLE